jgi:lambda family phage portal protein
MGGWTPVASSANAQMDAVIQTVRNRCRDLSANNPYGNKAKRVIASNMVGQGIKAQVKNISDQKQNKEIESLFKRWAESTKCDAGGKLNFYGIQSLIAKSLVDGGEIFIRRRKINKTRFNEIPFQLQVLEPEFLDDSKDSGFVTAGTTLRKGIEYNDFGVPIAYHFYKEHPSEGLYGKMETVRVPAEEVIHLYRMDRAGQLRGIPWLTPAVIRLKDLNDYESTQLIRQKISACFMAFVRDMNMNSATAGLPSSTDDPNKLLDKITPATIELLGPGRDVTFANPPSVGGDYESYTAQILRGISVGTGCTYEMLTNDYSRVNFSSGRMGWLEFQRELHEWQRDIFIMNFLPAVWDWFQQYAEIAGYNMSDIQAIWTPPRREMIDPANEINATKTEVRSGFNSLSGAIMELGRDPEEIFEAIKNDNQTLDSYGIILDSDPRHMSIAGQTQVEKNTADTEKV